MDKQQARSALRIDQFHRVILLGCGSMGCGHLERHALELAKRLPANVTLVVLCGRNEALARDLSEFSSDTFRVVGYTDEMPLYLSAADVYLTKPGGLMTTEAIAARLPMGFVEAVPGCETRNLDFLSALGVGEKTRNWKQAIAKAISMVENDEALEKQRTQMEHFHAGNSGMQICRYVLGK
jgi:processive 1,2-diacylglycerol beta-glucosyltransferase